MHMHLSPYLTNILIKYVDTKIVKLKHAVLKVSISKAWIFIFFSLELKSNDTRGMMT